MISSHARIRRHTVVAVLVFVGAAASIVSLRYFKAPLLRVGGPARETVVTLGEDGFAPAEVTIAQGETVIFRTTTGKHFWPASDLHPTHNKYPAFDPKKPVSPDATWSFHFTEVGVWNYHDHLAPYWTGTVTVEGPSRLGSGTPAGCLDETCWYEELFSIMKKKGVDAAFARIAELYGEEPQFTHHCHNIAHELGHLAFGFLRKGDVALSEKTAFCSYGFYHGFMESYAKERGPQAAREFCLSLDLNLVARAPDSTLQCFHGIGHGAVYLELPVWGDDRGTATRALLICDELAVTPLQRSRCASGVFNTIATMYNSGEFGFKMKKDQPLALCHEQPAAHREACYISMNVALMTLTSGNFPDAAVHLDEIPEDKEAEQAMLNLAAIAGALRMNDTAFEDHIGICRSLEERLRISCIQGFAYGFLEHGPPEQEYVKPLDFCALGVLSDEEQHACFKYVFGYLSFWYEPVKVRSICEHAKEEFRALCREETQATFEWRKARQ